MEAEIGCWGKVNPPLRAAADCRTPLARVSRRRHHVPRVRSRHGRAHARHQGQGGGPKHGNIWSGALGQPRRARALPAGADDVRGPRRAHLHRGRGARRRPEHGARYSGSYPGKGALDPRRRRRRRASSIPIARPSSTIASIIASARRASTTAGPFRGMARTTVVRGRVDDGRRARPSGSRAGAATFRAAGGGGSESRDAIGFGVNFMPTAPALRGRGMGQGGRAPRLRPPRHLRLAIDQPRRVRDARPCATATERIRFGSRVITPVTRHPAVAASAAATLAELAPGRTMIGIGSGDSAAYNIGAKAASARRAARVCAGDPQPDDHRARRVPREDRDASRGRACECPSILAASGPKTLRLAGQIADGAWSAPGSRPEIVRDSIAQVNAGSAGGRARSRRDRSLVVAGRRTWRRAMREAVEEIKTSLAMAGNHLTRFTTEGKHVPPDLLSR